MTTVNEFLDELLTHANKQGASDIHLKPGAAAHLRLKGALVPSGPKLSASAIQKMVHAMLTAEERTELSREKEIDYAYLFPRLGTRYRVNAYYAQGQIEAVMRVIHSTVRSTEELGLPVNLPRVADEKDGLILVGGATGSGKSTTLAALVDHINRNYEKRIITIENPVEAVHTDIRSLISQREVGGDTQSFHRALRSVMRQNPDVILIGEIRDKETADIALQAAQTGHLVFSTIHAGSAEEAVKRFSGLYPAEERQEAHKALASAIRAIIVQRLIIDVSGNKVPLVEQMRANDRIVQSMLATATGSGTGESLSKIMEESGVHEMNTLDQALLGMVGRQRLTPQRAVSEASNRLWLSQSLRSRGLLS